MPNFSHGHKGSPNSKFVFAWPHLFRAPTPVMFRGRRPRRVKKSRPPATACAVLPHAVLAYNGCAGPSIFGVWGEGDGIIRLRTPVRAGAALVVMDRGRN